MRQAITQVIVRKYLIGAIYTIPSCGQSVKDVEGISIGRGILAPHPSCCTESIIAGFRLETVARATTGQYKCYCGCYSDQVAQNGKGKTYPSSSNCQTFAR